MLRLMAFAGVTVLMSVAFPRLASPTVRLPGLLGLLPLHAALLTQARRHIKVHQGSNWSLYRAARRYRWGSENPRALAHLEHHIRRDFASGRVTILDGWLVSETEVALLASLLPA
jgi:hypothetical protein